MAYLAQACPWKFSSGSKETDLLGKKSEFVARAWYKSLRC